MSQRYLRKKIQIYNVKKDLVPTIVEEMWALFKRR